METNLNAMKGDQDNGMSNRGALWSRFRKRIEAVFIPGVTCSNAAFRGNRTKTAAEKSRRALHDL